jgi:hypothetical protein
MIRFHHEAHEVPEGKLSLIIPAETPVPEIGHEEAQGIESSGLNLPRADRRNENPCAAPIPLRLVMTVNPTDRLRVLRELVVKLRRPDS